MSGKYLVTVFDSTLFVVVYNFLRNEPMNRLNHEITKLLLNSNFRKTFCRIFSYFLVRKKITMDRTANYVSNDNETAMKPNNVMYRLPFLIRENRCL